MAVWVGHSGIADVDTGEECDGSTPGVVAVDTQEAHPTMLGAVSGLVRAFASACPSDGGEGATIVVLRGGK